MATVERRGQFQYRVRVRKKGYSTVTRTFTMKKDAEAWARKAESEMERGLYICPAEAEQTTLGEALERYAAEVTPHKKGAYQELSRIRIWQKHPLASRSLAGLRGADLAAYRDARLAAGISTSSVRLELAIISHLFTVAKKEWGMENLANPAAAIRRPIPARARDRRLEEGEMERLLEAAKASKSREIDKIIIIAVETGARRSEIIGMTWDHVNLAKQTWHIPITKNGDPRTVPLSSLAAETLNQLPRRIDGRVWAMKEPHGITQAFDRVCQRAEIENLHFHDLRHEATSRLFEMGLNMMEVAAINGHKSMAMLKRYTHLKAEDLVAKLG